MGNILGIIGAGHLGQQIAHYAITDKHFEQVVFFDDFAAEVEIQGCPVLGKTEDVIASFAAKKITHLMIGIGYKHMNVRAELFEKFSNAIPFATVIHSSCWVDPTAKIGRGVVIYPGSTVDANVTIEDNVLLNVGCTIAHDTKIASHCFLSPRVALAGFVSVGTQVQLGINCTVIDNITILAISQIGAGAVVVSDIIERGVYVGIPARLRKEK